MLLSEGKLPTFDNSHVKWERIVAQGNFFLRQFIREPGVDWNYYYDPAYSIGTITATDTFDLDEEVYKLSKQEGDVIRILHTDDRTTDYDIIRSELLRGYDTGFYVAQIGRTIRFNHEFVSTDPQFGGTIYAPVYLSPDPFSANSDEIPMPDPNWLVYMVAADRVKNDVTRKDLRNDLIAQANDSMEAMKQDNDAQISTALTPWSPTGHTSSDWWTQ